MKTSKLAPIIYGLPSIVFTLLFVIFCNFSVDIEIYDLKAHTGQINDDLGGSEMLLRNVTAYNVGIPAQTDNSPCIGATGENLCEALALGENIVATNELPLGTKVMINGKIYTVKDRTNSRYKYRYDIAMSADEYERAINFGIQTLEIEII